MRSLLRATGALLALAGLGWLAWRAELERPLPVADPPHVLDVRPGMHGDAIGARLAELGLVRHPALFKALVWSEDAGGRLRAGRYVLDRPLSLAGILELLERGQAERHDVTIPEGRSLPDVAALVATRNVSPEEFLAAASDPAPIRDLDPEAGDLEGYLFPDTYDVPQGEGAARTLVARMVGRFRAVATPLLPRIAAAGRSLREVVTLASIVELETALAEERPRIAAVFLNRLERGMPLQTDPTVIYALRQRGPYDGNIRKADLQLDSPYNTYRYPGLPPGPIGSPGKEALVAVLEPAPVKDLYFVSRNDGSHEFSETLRAHERAVDRYQRFRRNRAAKPSLSSGPPPRP